MFHSMGCFTTASSPPFPGPRQRWKISLGVRPARTHVWLNNSDKSSVRSNPTAGHYCFRSREKWPKIPEKTRRGKGAFVSPAQMLPVVPFEFGWKPKESPFETLTPRAERLVLDR